jgi:hypothetical protein
MPRPSSGKLYKPNLIEIEGNIATISGNIGGAS